MEYCFDNLRNVLTIKLIVFERNENQAMNSIEYFISCEIFRQITEALNCLHTFKPEPLIHTNLKPENILIGMSGNKRICKLADFVSPSSIKNISNYQLMTCDNDKYRAPEINSLQDCDIKSDIFSLGKVCLDVFDLIDPK